MSSGVENEEFVARKSALGYTKVKGRVYRAAHTLIHYYCSGMLDWVIQIRSEMCDAETFCIRIFCEVR